MKFTLKGSTSLLIAVAALGLGACKPDSPQLSETDVSVEPGEGAPAKPDFKGGASKLTPERSAKPGKPVPTEIWKEFSGDKAFAEVRKQVELGPRPSGSGEIEKARAAIDEALRGAGWDVERQEFTEVTPRGSVKFVNLVARFSPTMARPAPSNTQRAIICSHYDTKRFSTIRFTGANDGASSSGALLELARVLALDPQLAAKVELVFFDGEEAVVQFTESDGLYGSRFYARSLRTSQRSGQFQFGILWDMIGDKDLTITLPPDSPQPLTQSLLGVAEKLGVRGRFAYHDRSIWDDHVPLNQIKIPTVDLIDFDYLAWHTADDTLNQISPESLRTVGAVTLYFLRGALSK